MLMFGKCYSSSDATHALITHKSQIKNMEIGALIYCRQIIVAIVTISPTECPLALGDIGDNPICQRKRRLLYFV